MRALVVGVAVAAACVAQGGVHATLSPSCDFEGVHIAHRSSKYIVGRANKRGSIYGSCDSGTLTCYEDTGLADAPQGLNARVIDCDARLVNSRRRKLGVAINLLEDKWPKGLVFYRFSSKNALSESERDVVRQAMKTYEGTELGVAFQECEPTSLCNNKYVDISQKEDACYSYVGFTGEGGGQIMNLGKSCFEEPGTALHELGHALGLYHEHTHPEREVIVLTDGNLPVSASNYAKETDANLKPYDKASIMHYGRSAGLCLPKDQYPLESFCDVEITTNCVMPKKTHCNNTRNSEIGQRTQLSPGDLNTLKAIYGTKKPTLVPTSAPSSSTAAPTPNPTSTPSTTTPAPSTQTPPPSTSAPTPTTTQPAPVTTSPTPTTVKPTPTTETPAPSKTSTPTPPPSTPTPKTDSPAPTTATPAPKTTAPTTVPDTVTPAPSMTQSTPTSSAPTPTTERPSQTSPSPAPKTTSSSPKTTSPAPSTITTEAPPTPTVPTTPATTSSTQPATITPLPVTKAPSSAQPVPLTASPSPPVTSPSPRPAQSMTLAPPVAPTASKTLAPTLAPEASAPPVAPVAPRPVTPVVPLAPTRTVTPIAVPTARPGVLPVSPPTPTATSYNPGVVKPDTEQNSLWWSWWNTAGSNKRWADLPWAKGNGRWWPSSSSAEVSYDSDNSPVQQSVPKPTSKAPAKAKQTKKPTPTPKAKKTTAPPKAKGSYSFRGWGK